MKTCKLDEPETKKKREFKWALRCFALGFGITLAVFAVQAERGRQAEYAAMEAKYRSAVVEAKSANEQLALALKQGDCGLLLFNINPDIGYAQLRLVQVSKKERE